MANFTFNPKDVAKIIVPLVEEGIQKKLGLLAIDIAAARRQPEIRSPSVNWRMWKTSLRRGAIPSI